MSHIFLFQLAQLIVNAGGIAAVINYISDTQGNVRLPGVMMLGYVGAHSENLAMAVIVSKVRFYFAMAFILTSFWVLCNDTERYGLYLWLIGVLGILKFLCLIMAPR